MSLLGRLFHTDVCTERGSGDGHGGVHGDELERGFCLSAHRQWPSCSGLFLDVSGLQEKRGRGSFHRKQQSRAELNRTELRKGKARLLRKVKTPGKVKDTHDTNSTLVQVQVQVQASRSQSQSQSQSQSKSQSFVAFQSIVDFAFAFAFDLLSCSHFHRIIRRYPASVAVEQSLSSSSYSPLTSTPYPASFIILSLFPCPQILPSPSAAPASRTRQKRIDRQFLSWKPGE